MKWILILCLSFLCLGGTPSTGSDNGRPGTLNVRDLGARGNGVDLETALLQRAIDSCAISGDTLLFPAGTYLTGSLDLRSNTTLCLQRGAVILGSRNLEDYKEHQPKLRSYNDSFLRYSLFYAERDSNITITGLGTIDGQGKYFKAPGKEKPLRYLNRPYVIRFVECKNIRIENVRLQNSAMWMQHYLGCENLTIRGVHVFNHANMNNDMIDVDGCKGVTIADCYGDTDDDAIVLKSTSERITENVRISGCLLSSHCNAIKVGTESIGGFRNIAIRDCIVQPSHSDTLIFGKRGGISGITLAVVDGGILDSVVISGIVMDGPEVPIFVRLGNRARRPYDGAPVPGVGRLRNVVINDVNARNVKSTGCSITGLPGHPVENITVDFVCIAFAGGIQPAPAALPPELEDSYPESTMWGILPAYGFFVRHASNVRFHGCMFSWASEDLRPAFVFDDVTNLSALRVQAPSSPATEAVFVMSGVRTGAIEDAVVRGGGKAFVKFTNEQSSGIRIVNNNIPDIRTAVVPGDSSSGVFLSGNQQ